MKEIEIIDQFKQNKPFEGLKGINLLNIFAESYNSINNNLYRNNIPSIRSDIELKMDFSGVPITLYGEIKNQVTPKLLEQIAPLFLRQNKFNNKEIYALITPYLTASSQNYCLKSGINFIDLSGNISITVPGRIMIQRIGQKNKFPSKQILRNPFWGASSRVLRVLLQYPRRKWGISEIEKELKIESDIQKVDFKLSLASISKTIRSLEEELLIRKDQRSIIVPDPKILLFRWVDKYKEISKRVIRRFSFSNNPYGSEIVSSIKRLIVDLPDFNNSIVMGSTAANMVAPYLETDKITLYISKNNNWEIPEVIDQLRNSIGPGFELYYPFDEGVFMYSREKEGIRIASDIQIYLDCYSKGGREQKQADYVFENVIEKRWAKND
jgi:hypothetical protein